MVNGRRNIVRNPSERWVGTAGCEFGRVSRALTEASFGKFSVIELLRSGGCDLRFPTGSSMHHPSAMTIHWFSAFIFIIENLCLSDWNVFVAQKKRF
jgi:hypothetical protein